MSRCLLVFVREPVPGAVKTRLAARVGDKTACDFYRAFGKDILESMDELDATDVVVCFTPAEAGAGVQDWLGEGREYLPQRGADLGERMLNALEDAFSRGYGQAVLIGSDVPHVKAAQVREAFGMLEREPAVLCPADDGGYWLIGFGAAGVCREPFLNMAWSTDTVFAETLRRLQACGGVGVGPELTDVDTLENLQRVMESGALRKGSRTLAVAERFLGQ